MPVVTAVKRQKRLQRLSIFLDGKFAFGIDEAVWIPLGYAVGTTLTDDEIKIIATENSTHQVHDKLLHFISFRPRSEKEVRTKLIEIVHRIPLTEAEQEAILNKLREKQYVDDDAFGRWWIAERKRQGKGQKIVSYELRQKGLPDALISRLFDEEELAGVKEAVAFLEKNRWRFKREDPSTKKKMQMMLMRRGFEWSEVEEAINSFLD
jgi:regulatory protein